jgi:hypothetical protein
MLMSLRFVEQSYLSDYVLVLVEKYFPIWESIVLLALVRTYQCNIVSVQLCHLRLVLVSVIANIVSSVEGC